MESGRVRGKERERERGGGGVKEEKSRRGDRGGGIYLQRGNTMAAKMSKVDS